MTSRSRSTAAGLAAAVAASLALAVLPGLPVTAQLPGGGTPADDALALSQVLFPDGADTVVIARDDEPIDALAAGFAQGAVDGPLVLTPTDALSEAAEAEIARLGASSAIVLGGVAAVSPAVEDRLVEIGLDVTRYAGDTRIGTATATAAGLGADATTGIVARAFPAEGNPTSVFADSIGGGALAAGIGAPILLTDTGALTPQTLEALRASAITELLVVGGTAAVSDDVVAALEAEGLAVTRLAGDDRAVTAAAIAEFADADGPGITRVILVDGYAADGWASGFAAAGGNLDGRTAVLLSNGDALPPATADFLAGRAVEVLCGPNTTATACAAAQGAGEFRYVGAFDVADNGHVVAEIVDATDDGQTLVYTDAETGEIGFVDLTDPAAPVADGVVPTGGDPTSVAVAGDVALVGVNTSPDFVNPSGVLLVVDLATREVVREIALGGQPDAIAVSPSGDFAAIAIENERDEELDGGLIPQLPAGNLTVLDIADADPMAWTTRVVDLTGLAETAPSDPEVEYVDINDDDVAVVTLQENNHLVVVDLATAAVTADFSAGTATATDVDATEEELGPQGNGDIQLVEDVTRRREPDSVGWIGTDRFVTANEGDYEDADGEEGGSRSFTVFDVDGTVAFEAGSAFEHEQVRAGHFNEGRSANKGGEPEGIEVGTYGDRDLLFVGAERTNAVGVYDVSDGTPTFQQLLPTALGPEGIKALPGRDLLVITSESPVEGVWPALITVFERGGDGPAYPQIASADDERGVPIPWVALSGMTGGGDDATVHAVSDSILGVGYVYDVDTSTTPATITARTPVTGGAVDLDLEGIAPAADGGFWLASEGRYPVDEMGVRTEDRPNAIVRTDADGVVQEEVELPAELAAQATSSGFEGIAVDGDLVYVVVQREWADDAPGVVKIGRYDTTSQEWAFADYALDAVESPAGGWVGLSEITLLPDGTFAIVERDDRTGDSARIKRVYGVDLATVDFAPYGEPRPTVEKTLLADLLPVLQANSLWAPDKLESLAVTGDGRVVIATDNDGLDEAFGQTVYVDLGQVEAALAG